ncbi:MAG: hypothetical protein P4L79_18535 [Legionella sp.]|uniref:DUF6602 domain-containing protein n=1 Tax=Legionella sp. TaxID=459 RepID=UPI002849136B|nr:hypothetical protein [Legionella sp.]
MTQTFFHRLRSYYIKVAEVLRGEADAASVFANTTDIGMSRESVYAEFLKQHAPSKCNVFFGGFLFDEDGVESKQLDIIITTDTTPRYNFNNTAGSGKSFSPVEGTLGVVSVKSTLNKTELYDSFEGIASIPPTKSLFGRLSPTYTIKNYEDWPAKIIYASKGITPNTLLDHLNEYYTTNSAIPLGRRPNYIHVSGSCFIARIKEGSYITKVGTEGVERPTIGTYYLTTDSPDLQGILWTLNTLQGYATWSTHINFSYSDIINKISSLP